MELQVLFTPLMAMADPGLRGRTVVVIDTLRATTTIVTALSAGAREVAPVGGAEEAVKVANRLGTERTLLCGERGGLKINGFHLGNSPLEYTPDVVHGKTLVMTTTNGTAALLGARGAERVICGALVNARSTAGKLVELECRHLALLCAGTDGRFSMEDAITCGAIIAELAGLGAELGDMPDGAEAALLLFGRHAGDLAGALAGCDHGRHLAKIGLGPDLAFCAALNSSETVPVFAGSTIKSF